MVGDGPLFNLTKDHAFKLGLSNLHLVGRKKKVEDWYATMDAFLLTSSVEGLSNAVVEAQTCELPVVCFDVGGLKEAVEHGVTGYLVKDMDIDKYVYRSLQILKEPDLAARLG